MKVNILLIIIILFLSFFIIYSCDFVPITEDEFMNMNRSGSGSSDGSSSITGNATEVRLEDAGDYENGAGTFGDPARWLTNSNGRSLSVLNNDFQYDQVLNGVYNIYDDNNSGSFDTGRFFRVVIDGINTVNGGYNLTPVAKNLTTLASPPAGQMYIDPQRGKFVLPRPVYWSRCENIDNLVTNPDIKYNDVLFYSAYIIDVRVGKFGNGLIIYLPPDSYSVFYPLGSSYTGNSQYTFSMWFNMNIGGGQGPTYFHIGLNNASTTTITFSNDGESEWNNYIVIDGDVQPDDDHSNLDIPGYGYAHIYAVIDESGGLSNNESVQVYINGIKVMSATKKFNSDMFRIVMVQSEGGDNAYWLIDNIKIWTHVVSENPSWLYNGGSGRRDALHTIYGPANGYKPGSVKVGYYYY